MVGQTTVTARSQSLKRAREPGCSTVVDIRALERKRSGYLSRTRVRGRPSDEAIPGLPEGALSGEGSGQWRADVRLMNADLRRNEPVAAVIPSSGVCALPEHADSDLLTLEGNRITARKIIAGLGWEGDTQLWGAQVAHGIWKLKTKRPKSGPILRAKVTANRAHIALSSTIARAVGLTSGDKVLVLAPSSGLILVAMNQLYVKEIG